MISAHSSAYCFALKRIWFVLGLATILIFTSSIEANPIAKVSRSQAKIDLKENLLERYENNYSTVEMLLRDGMISYDDLVKISDNVVNNGILNNLSKRYYPNFSTILMLYKSNIESYKRLNK